MSAIKERTRGTQKPVSAGKIPAQSEALRANPALKGPVVLATRGSGDSVAASVVAQLLATKLERELHIVSVVEPMILYGLPPELAPGAIPIDEEARKTREADIRGPFARQLAPRVDWKADVRLGSPAADVCDAARMIDATLIVVGASPHRRLRRVISGQRAAQILHRSTSPVLSVAPWLKTLPTTVVAAIDFNVSSLRAAQAAMLMMEKGGALTLLHVIPSDFVFPTADLSNNILRTSIQKELDKIAHMLRKQGPAGVTVETVLVDGDAATEVLNAAERLDADLIAVGTRGGSAVRRALVGSVATEVFHSALCSVLASPPPPFADQMQLDLALKGSSETAEPKQFEAILDAFSARNKGKLASLEEDDSLLGAQIQVQGYKLGGVTYDRSDRRVEIMLSSPNVEGAHLTRTIPGVTSVAVASLTGGTDALQIKHGKSQTLVLIDTGKPRSTH